MITEVSRCSVATGPDLEICFRQSGSGPVNLLMVPGWTMDSSVFTRQLTFFSGSEFVRAIAMDPRGHGQSSKSSNGHSYVQHGHDINALVESLGLDNIVLCGWSFATLAILSYVRTFGAGKLSGLVMLDGPPRACGKDNQNDWVTYLDDDRDGFRQFFSQGVTGDRERFSTEFARWMLEDQSAANVQWIRDISSQMNADAAAQLNESSVHLDYRKDLVSLDGVIPLLYVMREERGNVAREWAARHTPSAKVVAFGKHLMFWERSDEFNMVLADFLSSGVA